MFPKPERFHCQGVALRLGMPGTRASALAGIAQALCADERLFDPRRDLQRQSRVCGSWPVSASGLPSTSRCGHSARAMHSLRQTSALQRKLARSGTDVGAQKLLAHAPSGGDRGERMPRCTYGWRMHKAAQDFRQRRPTMHLRLERYSAPLRTTACSLRMEEGTFARWSLRTTKSRMHRILRDQLWPIIQLEEERQRRMSYAQ